MNTKPVALIAVIVLLMVAAPTWAHHSFAAEFDAHAPVLLKGKVVKVQWINPHAWIHIEVEKPEGNEIWMIEGGTPNTLFRRGVTRDTLAIGTEIVVRGYQVKSGANAANGREITFPDGRKLFVGTKGTGAPDDGADPDK